MRCCKAILIAAIIALATGISLQAASADDGDDKALELIEKYRADCHVDLSENDKLTVPTDPKTASVEYEFGDDKTVALSLPAEDAHKDMAEKNEGGAAFYSGDSYDMAVIASEAGFSAYTVIHNETAPTAYEFDVTLPAGFKMSENEAGGVTILNADDGIEGIIIAPWAFDADGEAVTTQFKLNGDTLVQTVEHADAAYPVIADPDFNFITYRPNRTEVAWRARPDRWYLCRKAYLHSRTALSRAKARFGHNNDNSPSNAFSHCYWRARLTIDMGEETARGFGERREADAKPKELIMDGGNNEHGIRAGNQATGRNKRAKYRNADRICCRWTRDGTLQTSE